MTSSSDLDGLDKLPQKPSGRLNLMLTRRCNQACPYCFAANAMESSGSRLDMSWEECVECLDFMKRSQSSEVALLGGEPTLHTRFEDVVERALALDMAVTLFTNFLFAEPIGCLAQDRVNIIANINSLDFYRPAALAMVRQNLHRYRANTTIGFNVHDFDDGYLGVLELVDECGLEHRQLRLGIASPTPDATNSHIPLERFERVGAYMLQLGRAATERNIKLNLDCGFVRCMFEDEQLQELQNLGQEILFRCGTPVDVGPGLEVWHCFPLSNYPGVHLGDFRDVTELRGALGRKYYPYHAFGFKKECPTCEHHLSGCCPGGCLGHVLRTVEHAPTGRGGP